MITEGAALFTPADPAAEAARLADPEEMRAFLETAIEVIDAADDEEAELREYAEYLASAFAATPAATMLMAVRDDLRDRNAVAQRLLSMTPDLIPVYAGLLRGALAQVDPNALRIQEVSELFPPWMRTMIVRYEEAL